MLRTLSIRDVVLIDRLDLGFMPGLCVLTGETGAGKSILLDALGLALGIRADARLVRTGTEQASVTAEFDLPADHPVWQVIEGEDIDRGEGELLLRRVVSKDGRSRAYLNDQAISIGLLKRIGDALVEVHGQFENQRLLDPGVHRGLLDAYGVGDAVSGRVATAHQAWAAAKAARETAEADMEAARRDEEHLRHSVSELAEINPVAGEDEELAQRRALMMNGEKVMEALRLASEELQTEIGVEESLRAALRHLERVNEATGGKLSETVGALERAASETAEAEALLARDASTLDLDPKTLERVEERLFALRGLARKHGVEADGLAPLLLDLTAQLAALEDGGASLDDLIRAEAAARDDYITAAGKLTAARAKGAKGLDKAVMGELGPLKLEKAVFSTRMEPLAEENWGAGGAERVTFEVSTNPGQAPGPINRIASGGELSRFTLALKAALADADPVPTLVFDEVDSGIGGAVASAVGVRLAALSETCQVLVVTHSPQVAAQGATHFQVSKKAGSKASETTVITLDDNERKEEIARMLAGSTVTEEARAAANRLLQGEVA